MKFRKLLISASVVAAGTGLLATVLTSCAKQNIDKDLKIQLDRNGNYIDETDQSFITDRDFKSAIKNALKSSSTWEAFKECLAKEIVLKWYEDRQKTDAHPKRNESFTNFLNRQKYQIDEDYNKQIDSLKSKYGANHPFYVQNELLAKNGGTEAAYKHLKLLDKVKDDFVTNVFTTNYFSIANQDYSGQFPHIFTNVMSSSLAPEQLNDPALWSKIGFYAKANSSFVLDDASDTDALASHPDGDYAIIQNFVFNRWFKTERPFFSAASLFKYANPVSSGENLKAIYNSAKISASLDKPTEAFPFFGKAKKNSINGYEGTIGFWHWYNQLIEGQFQKETYVNPTTKEYVWNKTITIQPDFTEDSQTLLLCYSGKMLGGSDGGTLYPPYAVAAASLYNQMLNNGPKPSNVIDQELVKQCVNPSSWPGADEESPRILKMFFYPNGGTADDEKKNIPEGVKSYIDLKELYDYTQDASTGEFHSALFNENKKFPFLYGDTNAQDKNGVRFVTNNVQAELKPTKSPETELQPWVFELNEAGMHAQTIDGYLYVKGNDKPYERLKEVVKYRLMQQQCKWLEKIVSASVLGSSGDLKTYFSKHFADIILEMAFSYDAQKPEDREANIFRSISTYSGSTYTPEKEDDQFFTKFCKDEKFGAEANIRNYLEAVKKIDDTRRDYNLVVAANKTIYNYRSKQITNSKFNPSANTRYDNGLLAPLGISYENSDFNGFGTTHHYATIVNATVQSIENCTRTAIENAIENLANQQFITRIDSVKVDDKNDAFSPQIDDAIKAESNRFWFKSSAVDKILCQFMDASTMANHIKISTYNKYQTDALAESSYKIGDLTTGGAQGIASAYQAKKLISGDNTFASYAPKETAPANYFTLINNIYENKYLKDAILTNGPNCDENLNKALYYTTIAWLAKDDFKHFYEALDQKIKDGERSYIGYLAKYNSRDPFIKQPKEETTLTSDPFPYAWDADVGNIYDDYGYAGAKNTKNAERSKKIDFDSYWNVVNKKFNDAENNNAATTKLLSGFLGLQTPSSNQLDSSSGLHDTAFGNNFGLSTLNTKTVDTQKTLDYEQGTLFPWAGAGKENTDDRTKDTYYFKDVTFGDKTIKYLDFEALKPARKLAQTIALTSAPEDIQSLAYKIGSALINGNNAFMKVANGEIGKDDPRTAADAMKYYLLNDLKTNADQQYTHAFSRIINAEFKKGRNGNYCFENTSDDGFKFMYTQLNKSDVKEQKLHPTFANSTWKMVDGSPLTLEEFWFIFASVANEAAYQDEAMKDAIKVVFKGNKLVVHDAQIYNKFDAVWIKDWKKKTLG